MPNWLIPFLLGWAFALFIWPMALNMFRGLTSSASV